MGIKGLAKLLSDEAPDVREGCEVIICSSGRESRPYLELIPSIGSNDAICALA
jgi:hypothetical protein